MHEVRGAGRGPTALQSREADWQAALSKYGVYTFLRAYRGGVTGLCPIWPLEQRALPGTGPFSPLVGQRLCAVEAATGALGRCALEKGTRTLCSESLFWESAATLSPSRSGWSILPAHHRQITILC